MRWLSVYSVQSENGLVPLTVPAGQSDYPPAGPPPDAEKEIGDTKKWLDELAGISPTQRTERIAMLLEGIDQLAVELRQQRRAVLRGALALHYLVEAGEYRQILDRNGNQAFLSAEDFEVAFMREEGLGDSASRLSEVRRGVTLWLALRNNNLPTPEALGRIEPLLRLPLSTAVAVFQQEAERAATEVGTPVVPSRACLDRVARELAGKNVERSSKDPDVVRREVLGRALGLAKSIHSELTRPSATGLKGNKIRDDLFEKIDELEGVLRPTAATEEEVRRAWDGRDDAGPMPGREHGPFRLVEHWEKLEFCLKLPEGGGAGPAATEDKKLETAAGELLEKFGWKRAPAAAPTWEFALPRTNAAVRARAAAPQMTRVLALAKALYLQPGKPAAA